MIDYEFLHGLKICYLAGTLGQGGAERQLFYQLQALKKNGADPTVICLTKDEFWQNQIEGLNIPVLIVRNKSRVERLISIVKLINQIKPHVIQAQHFYLNFYAALAAKLLAIQDIGTIRSDGYRDVSETGKLFGQLCLRFPRRIVANSNTAIGNLIKLGRSKSTLFYIPNVVDTRQFFPQHLSEKENIEIVMVGRLSQPKRFDLFLSALSTINRGQSNVIVGHIVGDGPDKQNIIKLATEYGLSDKELIFHGTVVNVKSIYQRADICVHLSDWEGLPNSILEAMSSGLPVIATRVGGIPEIVVEGLTGLLTDPGDNIGVVKGLQTLINDEGKRRSMGGKGRLFVERYHSLNQLPKYLNSFYGKVII